MKRFGVFALLSCFASAALASDVTSSYSPSSNPNGDWSFGYRTAVLGTGLTLFDVNASNPGVTGALDSWQMSSGFTYLGAYKNVGAVGYDGGEGTQVPAGEFMMHPEGSAVAVARYTATVAGSYNVTYSTARYGGANGSGSFFSLVNNGVLVAGNAVSPDPSYAYNTPSVVNVTLGIGDTLDFVVDNGGNGDSWDSTGLRADVQAVPEPASMVALGVGALGLLRRRRKA